MINKVGDKGYITLEKTKNTRQDIDDSNTETDILTYLPKIYDDFETFKTYMSYYLCSKSGKIVFDELLEVKIDESDLPHTIFAHYMTKIEDSNRNINELYNYRFSIKLFIIFFITAFSYYNTGYYTYDWNNKP